MQCSKCKSIKSIVIDSRSRDMDKIKYRRHKCLSCGNKYSTHEINDIEYKRYKQEKLVRSSLVKLLWKLT